MICPNCHTENRANAKYCDECGFELPTVAPIAKEIFDSEAGIHSAQDTLVFDGLDQMVDSSYDPYPDTDHMADADDITRSFIAFSDQQQRRVYRGGGSSGMPPSQSIPFVGESNPSYRYGESVFVADVAQTPHQGAGTGAIPPVGGAPGAKDGKMPHPPDPLRRKRILRNVRIAVIAILCVAIAAGIAAAVTYSMQLWGGKIVPDVVGMQSSEAKAQLEELGFAVDVVQVKSDEVENIVLSTDPEYGVRINEGSTVRINVSVARVIPDIVGKTKDEAAALLAQEGFTNIEYSEVTSNEPEGTIISTAPVEGTRAKGNAKITLEVAVPFRVPEVKGMTADEARAALESLGYHVTTKEVYAEDVEEGRAAGTDPVAGSALPSGSDVVLNLAKHRSSELVALTRAFLNEHDRVKINGVNYEISEISKVSYTRNNTCTYTIVARKYETNTWAIFGQTETRYGNYETINGTIQWNDSNEIQSMDPEIKEA